MPQNDLPRFSRSKKLQKSCQKSCQKTALVAQGFLSSLAEIVPSFSISGRQGKGSAPPSSSRAATTALAYFCSFGSPGYLFEAFTNCSCDKSSKEDPLNAPPATTRRPCLVLVESISCAPVRNDRTRRIPRQFEQLQFFNKVHRHDKLKAKWG